MDMKVETPAPEVIKLAFFGAKGVGKSTIFNWYFHGRKSKPEDVEPVAEKNEETALVKSRVCLQATDAESVDASEPPDVLFLVYSPYHKKSFNYLDEKLPELKKQLPNCKFILVASKRFDDSRALQVTQDEAIDFCSKHGMRNEDYIFQSYIHTPSFTHQLFQRAAAKGLYAKQERQAQLEAAQRNNRPVSACFFMKTMKASHLLTIVGGLLLLAGVAAVVAGTCGAGALGLAAGAALGLTIGGGAGAGLGAILAGIGACGLFKGCRQNPPGSVGTVTQLRRGSLAF